MGLFTLDPQNWFRLRIKRKNSTLEVRKRCQGGFVSTPDNVTPFNTSPDLLTPPQGPRRAADLLPLMLVNQSENKHNKKGLATVLVL